MTTSTIKRSCLVVVRGAEPRHQKLIKVTPDSEPSFNLVGDQGLFYSFYHFLICSLMCATLNMSPHGSGFEICWYFVTVCDKCFACPGVNRSPLMSMGQRLRGLLPSSLDVKMSDDLLVTLDRLLDLVSS